MRIAPFYLLLFLAACAGEENGIELESDTLTTETTATQDTSSTIYDVLQEEGRFSQFTAAIDSAGLEQTLTGPGPYTIFAPSDDAFRAGQSGIDSLLASGNRDQLQGVLLHHIASGETASQDLQENSSIRTLEGSDLTVSGSGGNLRVGSAEITETDIDAANGVIHVVNRLLDPESSQEGI